jgi:hypothetical protein
MNPQMHQKSHTSAPQQAGDVKTTRGHVQPGPTGPPGPSGQTRAVSGTATSRQVQGEGKSLQGRAFRPDLDESNSDLDTIIPMYSINDGGKQQTNAYGVFVQACWDLHKRQYPEDLIHKEIEKFNESFLKSIGWYEDLSEQQHKRPARLHHVASHRGYKSGGDDFVPDAVGSVADRDLGPGVVLGEGGGEDVVEEVWGHAVLLLEESGRTRTSEDQVKRFVEKSRMSRVPL